MKSTTATKPEAITLKRKCKQCRGPITISMQRGVPRELYLSELFCSTECCKDYHGVPHTSPPVKTVGRPPVWPKKRRNG